MKTRLLLAVVLALGGAASPGAAKPATEVPFRSGPVALARIDGSINPASSDYIQSAIREAEEMHAAILLLELDTPGGLVASTKDIIQAMLAAQVPIVVYVSPQGAWAGSAGTYITLAAHVAAMAPGSSIGAAHPVGIGMPGGPPKKDEKGKQGPSSYEGQKAENMLVAFIQAIAAKRKRNVKWAEKAVRESVAVTAEQAKDLGVIDLVASSRSELLHELEGRVVDLDTGPVRLKLAGAVLHEIEMPLSTRVLNVVSDPNIATLLFLAGLLGLYIEFNHPGVILPGAVGGVCLLLALIAMQILPFSWVGVLVILVGLGLLAAELFVTSYGLLFVGGVACLLIGGSMVFDRPDLSDLNVDFWSVLLPAVSGFVLFGALVVWAVGRTLNRSQQSGVDDLIGMRGTATTSLDPAGTVFIRGEFWRAEADEAIEADAAVEATGLEGMLLKVRRAQRSRPG